MYLFYYYTFIKRPLNAVNRRLHHPAWSRPAMDLGRSLGSEVGWNGNLWIRPSRNLVTGFDDSLLSFCHYRLRLCMLLGFAVTRRHVTGHAWLRSSHETKLMSVSSCRHFMSILISLSASTGTLRDTFICSMKRGSSVFLLFYFFFICVSFYSIIMCCSPSEMRRLYRIEQITQTKEWRSAQ